MIGVKRRCFSWLKVYNLLSSISPSQTKLNIAQRAFFVAAPTILNQLPTMIKYSETVGTFHKKN